MRPSFAVLFLVSTGALGTGCTKHCVVTGDCSRGQICNLDDHTCFSQCASDRDCSATAHCDLEYGLCKPMAVPLPPKDAGMQTDTGTVARDAGTHDTGAG